MSAENLEYFKAIINSKKDRSIQELGFIENSSMRMTIHDQSGYLSSYSFHMADQGTDTMSREIAFSIAARQGKYLTHLDEALRRIENGAYGVCRTCGQEINRERLEAVPNATQCIVCKNADEKKKRGIGSGQK